MWAAPLPERFVASEEAGEPSGQLLVYQSALGPPFHPMRGQHWHLRLH